VDNKYSSSGVINAWVDVIKEYYTRFGLTVAYGYKISEKSTPSLDIYGNDFYTMEGKYYFSRSILLAPNEKGYIYIYAKPYHLHQKEYYCTGSLNNCVPTGEERVQEGINDIETTGENDIVGGSRNGLPDSEIMSRIYSGTDMKYATALGVGDSKPCPTDFRCFRFMFGRFRDWDSDRCPCSGIKRRGRSSMGRRVERRDILHFFKFS